MVRRFADVSTPMATAAFWACRTVASAAAAAPARTHETIGLEVIGPREGRAHCKLTAALRERRQASFQQSAAMSGSDRGTDKATDYRVMPRLTVSSRQLEQTCQARELTPRGDFFWPAPDAPDSPAFRRATAQRC